MMMQTTSNITPSRLLTLYEVSKKINSELNLEKLLDEIMDQAIALLKAEKGLVLLKDGTSGELTVEIARALDKQQVMDKAAMSRTVIDKVKQNGKPVLMQKVPDVQNEDTSKSMMLYKLKSIVCVPLRSKEQLIGAIYLDTTRQEHFFKEEDLVFLEAFANLAGVAIQNARHYKEIEALNANLEKKVEQRTEELQLKNTELIKACADLEKAQLQLIRSEIMASLGNLVAGIAHEINSPLGSLNSNMDLFARGFEKIKRELETNGEIETNQRLLKTAKSLEALTGVSQAACERISHIVKALRNFARLDEGETKSVDIHEGVDSTLILLENKYQDRIAIAKNYGDLPKLKCQPAQINQVFMSILVNAGEAISGNGTIYISTGIENNNIRVEIKDSGRGIPRENLEKIFDPGFTTKGVKVGIGLGLAISYKIVEDHGGTIRVESEEGKGSTFIILLPVVP